jgi:prefoldin beta subunit
MSQGASLPPQLQEQLLRLQQLQQTLQVVVTQRQQLELEGSELEKALNELGKIDDADPVYKSIGTLLVRSERKTVIDELQERRELVNTRVTVLTRQQSRAEAKVKELQQSIQSKLRTSS